MPVLDRVRDGAVRAVRKAATEARELGYDVDREDEHVEDALRAYFAKADSKIRLVGVKGASEILDVPKPRIYKLIEQERMPTPWRKLDNGPLFDEGEVKALAVKLRRERKRRETNRTKAES